MSWYKKLASKCRFKTLHDRDKLQDPYLVRYYIFKSKVLSIYIHKIIRSDNTQDYHDHPWPFAHVVLEGGYSEETPGRCDRKTRPGSIAFRRSSFSHRLELYKDASGNDIETWTLVFIGPKIREWGFIGRLTGCWVGWEKYVFDKERCE